MDEDFVHRCRLVLNEGAAVPPDLVESRILSAIDELLRRLERRRQGRGYWLASERRYDRAVSAPTWALRQQEAHEAGRSRLLELEAEHLDRRAACDRLRGLR